MTDKMKLYFHPASPYVRKVTICLHELALFDQVVLEPTVVAPHAPNQTLARLNPLMKMPTLEPANGTALFDSVVICEYLNALAKGHLFPVEGEERWSALRLHSIGDGVLDAALLARYETAIRPAALLWPEWLAGQFAKVDYALDLLETECPTFGNDFHIGQITVACALGYLDFRFADRPWRTGRDALATWFLRISQRESMALTVPHV